MTYNVFVGSLNLTQPINRLKSRLHLVMFLSHVVCLCAYLFIGLSVGKVTPEVVDGFFCEIFGRGTVD